MKAVVNRVPLHPGRVELRQVSGQIYDLTRADEPTVIGDPLDQDLFARIQADIRDVTVRAGQSITAGDVVAVQGEEVYREVTAFDNVETVVTSAATTAISCCKLTSKLFVMMCQYASTAIRLSLCATDDVVKVKSTISPASGKYSETACDRLSDSAFAALYIGSGYLYARVITVASDVMSAGAEVQISTATTNYCKLLALSATQFAVIYNRSGLKIRICTVSGTTITLGTEYALSGNAGAYRISACLLAANKIGICFADNAGKAVIATISGTAVTFGSVATFHSGAEPYCVDCCEANGDIAVITGYANNSCVLAQVLSVSGTSISTATPECSIKSGDFGYYTKIRKVGGKLVALYYKRLESARACVLSRNGNALTKHDEYAYNGSAGVGGIDAAVLNDDTLAVCYADSGNSSYGTATILTVNGDQIAGSFEDTGSDAIALESGAAGQRIAVAKSGNVQLAGVKTGDRIDSPGVSAYAPLDGWLTVTAKEAPGYVTGVYKGDGTSGQSAPTVIDLGFCPSAVAVIAGENGYNNRVPLVMVKGMTYLVTETDGTTDRSVNVKWTETGVEFYSNVDVGQFNRNGSTYYYIAWR